MSNYNVLCIGSATVDNFLVIGQPLSSVKIGDKILVNSSEIHSGGGATNSAAALAKMGLKVKMLTKLGPDAGAELILNELKKYKVKNICLRRSKHSTDSATIISSTQEKDRIIYVNKGASEDLTLTDCPKNQLKVDWIYLGSLLGKSFQAGKQIAAYAAGKKISLLFNPSLYLAKKGKKILSSILKSTTILILNHEEALSLTGIKDTSSTPSLGSFNFSLNLLLSLHSLGPRSVIITDGKNKLYAYNCGNVYWLNPPAVKVVHTAGAGDAFNSGLLAAIIKGYSFADALRIGQANASSIIQHLGTKNKLLTEREALQFIRHHKIKVEVKAVVRDEPGRGGFK